MPRLLFQTDGRDGTMVKMRVGAMNLYFRYKDAEKDTVYVGMSRFAATPEVLQNTYVENDGLAELIEHDTQCTYLKTPAGVFTEITLPVNEIYQGHLNDSISQAQFSLYRYNAANQESAFEFPRPCCWCASKTCTRSLKKGKCRTRKHPTSHLSTAVIILILSPTSATWYHTVRERGTKSLPKPASHRRLGNSSIRTGTKWYSFLLKPTGTTVTISSA